MRTATSKSTRREFMGHLEEIESDVAPENQHYLTNIKKLFIDCRKQLRSSEERKKTIEARSQETVEQIAELQKQLTQQSNEVERLAATSNKHQANQFKTLRENERISTVGLQAAGNAAVFALKNFTETGVALGEIELGQIRYSGALPIEIVQSNCGSCLIAAGALMLSGDLEYVFAVNDDLLISAFFDNSQSVINFVIYWEDEPFPERFDDRRFDNVGVWRSIFDGGFDEYAT